MNPFTIKTPKAENEQHLNNIRNLPCLVCGNIPSEPAHVRFACARYGKPEAGMGKKPRGPNGEECLVNPLCPDCHRSTERSQHRYGDEERWWRQYDIDPHATSAWLWINRGHPDRMLKICENNRAIRALKDKP